jgi:hypothetical protein
MPGKSSDTIKKFETEKSSFSFNTSLVVFDPERSGYYLEDQSKTLPYPSRTFEPVTLQIWVNTFPRLYDKPLKPSTKVTRLFSGHDSVDRGDFPVSLAHYLWARMLLHQCST